MQILKDAFRKARKENKKGFTLVELLVVIAVIGILFVTLISKVDFATDKAKETGVKTTFRNYQTGLEATAREKNGFGKAGGTAADLIGYINLNLDKSIQIASDQASAADLVDASGVTHKVTDGKKVLDPWGNAYKIYFVGKTTGGNNSRVVLQSAGKDGQYNDTAVNPAVSAATGNADKLANPAGTTDDIYLVVDYIGGQVNTYSYGLSTNLGE